jgi:hypothetical protein
MARRKKKRKADGLIGEGAFLKSQLGGIQSTEDPRPLFRALSYVVVGAIAGVIGVVVGRRSADT